MKTNHAVFLLILVIVAGCQCSQQSSEGEVTGKEIPSSLAFLQQIQTFCDTVLEGEIIKDSDTPPTNTNLSMQIERCTPNEVRIRLLLKNDLHKTIILTWVDDNLLLKHDIRDANLSPEEPTMYGGFAQGEEGSIQRQLFPVHNFGFQMWPGYEHFAWEILCIPEEGLLEYKELKGEEIVKHYRVKLTSTQPSNH